MATTLSYKTLHKKKPGTLTYSKSSSTLTWTADAGSTPAISIAMSAVTNLQQTPASNPNVIIKVFYTPQGKSEAESVAFQFSSATDARAEKDVLMEEMRKVIEGAKAAASSTAPASKDSTPKPTGSATPAEPAPDPNAQFYSNAALLSNQALHKSYLDANPAVNKRLMTLVQSKPASQTISDFYTSFWSPRLPALRLFALERAQKKGAYNVLASIKTSTDADGRLKLNVAGEQIALLQEQHPIVAKAFRETVAKDRGIATPEEFWTRFFTSKLFKRLKGERINSDVDRRDAVLDRYLDQMSLDRSSTQLADDAALDGQAAALQHAVPHYIDLSGNESNTKWKGNALDETMRPTQMAAERVSAFDGYNAISSRLVANVAPADGEGAAAADGSGTRKGGANLHLPAGALESSANAQRGGALDEMLRLQDLGGDADDSPLKLNVQAPRAFGPGRHRNDHSDGVRDVDMADTPRIPGESLSTATAKLSDLNWELDLSDAFENDGGGTFILPRASEVKMT